MFDKQIVTTSLSVSLSLSLSCLTAVMLPPSSLSTTTTGLTSAGVVFNYENNQSNEQHFTQTTTTKKKTTTKHTSKAVAANCAKFNTAERFNATSIRRAISIETIHTNVCCLKTKIVWFFVYL
jgi:hypothetical protein